MKILDKNVSNRKTATSKLLILMSLVLTSYQLLTAQNTSYYDNSAGIGGTACSAFGYHSLYANSIGANNTASGIYALASNTTGSSNTAFGTSALRLNTTGILNTATGHDALYYNNGILNTANGVDALFNNGYGSYNTAMGSESGYGLVSGNNNTFIGADAGYKNDGYANIFIGNSAGYYETGSNKLYIANASHETILYGDLNTGQVLLGYPDPTGYSFKGTRTLNVLGGILTDSMRLAPSANWADKVFKKNYSLKSLDELEKYISANKHLPGIPTASEVQSIGVNVGDMETKLLEKIEELTLYVLELKKENQQQQKEINKLKGRRK
jgi:hypothetical protein